MNKGKIKRIARDLSTMTMPEAMAVAGTLMQGHSVTVAASVVDMLSAATTDPESALRMVQGTLWLLEVGRGNRIAVIKAIKAHSPLKLKEAKELAESWPVALTRKNLEVKMSATQKTHFAQDLRDAGATVEFRG